MKKYESRCIEDIVCVERTCNKCGKVESANNSSEIQEFKIEWGYLSPFDMEIWLFELCSTCLSEIIDSFKIPVEKNNYGFKYFSI